MTDINCSPGTDECGAGVRLSLTWKDSDGNERQEFGDAVMGLSNRQAMALFYEHRGRISELFVALKPSDGVDVAAIATAAIGE